VSLPAQWTIPSARLLSAAAYRLDIATRECCSKRVM